MTRLCLLAFVVACSHSTAPRPAEPTVAAVPAADPAPCPDVAIQAVKLMPGADRAKPVIERHCIGDAWSVELRKCMLLAKTQEELEPCHQQFAGTQFEDLQRDLDTHKAEATLIMPVSQPAAPDVPPAANTMPK